MFGFLVQNDGKRLIKASNQFLITDPQYYLRYAIGKLK